MLHIFRLRQDGIMSTTPTVSSSFAIPFGISRPERYKTTEILRAYIQNTSSVLNFGDLQPRDIVSNINSVRIMRKKHLHSCH